MESENTAIVEQGSHHHNTSDANNHISRHASDPNYSFWYIAGPLLFHTYSSIFFLVTLFTYSGFLVHEIWPLLPVSAVGYYAGILISSFYLGQCGNGLVVGFLSDYFGIMPSMGLSALAGIIFPLLYGFSKEYWLLCAFTVAYGFLNSTSPLFNAQVHHSLTPLDSQFALSYSAACWGVAGMTAPMIAGFLSYPAQKHPSLDYPILRQFPFLLPNLVTAFLNALSLLHIVYSVLKSRAVNRELSQTVIHSTAAESIHIRSVYDEDNINQSNEVQLTSSHEHCAKQTDSSSVPTHQTNLSQFAFFQYVRDNNNQILFVIVTYSILGFSSIVIDTAFPLLLMLPYAQGGFSEDTNGVALAQIILGVFMLCSAPIAPMLTTRLGLRLSFWSCALFTIPFIICVPLSTFIFSFDQLQTYAFGMCIFCLGISRQLAIQVCYLSGITLINYCVAPRFVSHVNGLSAFFGSISKFVGPSISSAMFAWSTSSGLPFPFNYFFVFLFDGLIYLILVLCVLRLREQCESPRPENG